MLLPSCEDPYLKQPLSGTPDSLETGINATQIAAIQEKIGTDRAAFTFAVTSDIHAHHDELRSMLAHARSDSTISFILVCGDVTDKGNSKELQKYNEIMKEQALPYVTAIGNREHYGTGRPTFEAMFGARNSQFVAGGVRFILFDDVVTESDLPIEYDWLRTTLAVEHNGPTIIVAHVPPTDDSQLSPDHQGPLNAIIAEFKPDLILMGHTHAFSQATFPDGTLYTTVSWPKGGEYVKVRVEKEKISTELILIR